MSNFPNDFMQKWKLPANYSPASSSTKGGESDLDVLIPVSVRIN